MKILTVRQPWASEIIAGRKNVENRTWMPTYTGFNGSRIGIHAGVVVDRTAPEHLLGPEHLRDRGVVLGTVQVLSIHGAGDTACVAHGCAENPWAMWGPGVLHWMLREPRPLITPIRWKGQLGLWESPSVTHLLNTEEYQ